MSLNDVDMMTSNDSEFVNDRGPLYDDRAVQEAFHRPIEITDCSFLLSLPRKTQADSYEYDSSTSSAPGASLPDPQRLLEDYFSSNWLFNNEVIFPSNTEDGHINTFDTGEGELLQFEGDSVEDYYDPLVVQSYQNDFGFMEPNLMQSGSSTLSGSATLSDYHYNLFNPSPGPYAIWTPPSSSNPDNYTEKPCRTQDANYLPSTPSSIWTNDSSSPESQIETRKRNARTRTPTPSLPSPADSSEKSLSHSSKSKRSSKYKANDIKRDDLVLVKMKTKFSNFLVGGEVTYRVYQDRRGKLVYECREPECGGKFDLTYNKRDLKTHFESKAHCSKRMYQCKFPGCDRAYTRDDARKRHELDKHLNALLRGGL